jgi:pimeloyl-ACP methyl ester carboxylesterase
MKKFILIAILITWSAALFAQQTIEGEWKGAVNVQAQQLVVEFDIEKEADAFSGIINIPQQGAMGLNLTTVEQHGDSIRFAFFTGSGDGVFEGIFSSDSLITGTYSQGPASFLFEIKKQLLSDEPEPGQGTDLVIQGDGVEIGGTLVYPEGEGEAPLVILISGSGAQNRDSNIFEFKIFAEMAEHLKKNGIASFRYDDRQIGKSTGIFMNTTLEMLAGDVESIITHLTEMNAYNFGEIVLLGHSQGGVVAGKVAAENESVDQLILMASTGLPLKDILRFQVKQGFGEGIHDEEDVEKEIDLREELMGAIRDDSGVEVAKQAYMNHYKSILEKLPKERKTGIPDVDAFVQQQVQQLVAYYGAPQTKSLLFYDPADDLAELDIPALVVFGEKDTQVTEEMNRAPIEKALKTAGISYEVKVMPEANHLFQKANTGMASEYAMLDKEFVDGFLEVISEWVAGN